MYRKGQSIDLSKKKNSILSEIGVKIRNFTSLLHKNTFDFGLWAEIESIFVKQVNKYRDFRP